MRTWLVALLCALCHSIANGELKWDRQRVELAPGPTDPFVDATFGFINAGTAPVTVERLESFCDCATASLPKMTIGPGERSEIKTRFNIGNRRGLQTKTVTVHIKGEAEPVILSLVVSIPELVKMLPQMVAWQLGETPKPKTISLQAAQGQPVKIVKVVSSEPNMKVKLETIREGQEYAIVVTPQSTAKAGFSVLTISAEYKDQKPSLSAYAHVKQKRP